MRNRSQRMPVRGMDVGEGPSNALERQTIVDSRILANVIVVIVVNEPMAKRLAEDQPHDCCKENTDNRRPDVFSVSATKKTVPTHTGLSFFYNSGACITVARHAVSDSLEVNNPEKQ